ncbi:MAG TPA: thioredoxin family protein [Pyrinomonadaceae bacterium]|nr:thioredoxin family protein [Pyrinomonadaceae bacterium]
MRHFTLLSIILLILTAATIQGQTPKQQDDGSAILQPATTKKDLYPANVDAGREIDEAIKHAAHDHKRVILIFGGNWCYDCHVLDQALHQGTAGKIVEESYELVHIDVGEFNKNLGLVNKYKVPLNKGVPAVAVLDSKGKLLYSAEGEFEAARKMMKKQLVEFLLKWKENKASVAGKS